MIHETSIKKYKGTLKVLSIDIGDLRYDALSEFLKLLSEKIQHDADQDKERGRLKLANELYDCSKQLKQSKSSIDRAWEISAPFM